ncbi:DUF29 domain-containing protein [Jiella sp. MQZ9-1]|uniref:DUF29 domain-containing protein n=1 Tax=Jiella flava TaxID=2816857 RepID=A0A939FXR1_9HYPH|nr:DUF29 domain-containing protein [Jiella flava]MBO0663923.1 DUF29 domain-containing protein [Jiella flava]MCD2472495.1 DUF29 domain-containing protein [Jiella flava]
MSLAKDKPSLEGPILYENDFTAWASQQADLLRARRLSEIDLPNLVEEIESLGNEQLHALESFYILVISHLLKWQFQPERRSRSWDLTIYESRGQIVRREKRSPSLRARAQEIVNEIYPDARGSASKETGLSLATFPESCPYTAAQLRDHGFLPE